MEVTKDWAAPPTAAAAEGRGGENKGEEGDDAAD